MGAYKGRRREEGGGRRREEEEKEGGGRRLASARGLRLWPETRKLGRHAGHLGHIGPLEPKRAPSGMIADGVRSLRPAPPLRC
jgi:hypothetical protein